MSNKTDTISPASFKTLGGLIRYLREYAHLSQRELASIVDYHYSYISRVENNQLIPEAATLLARFVPALGLEDAPQWRNRLVELSQSGNAIQEIRSEPTVSEENLDTLPTSLTSMLGREAEFASLRDMLLDPKIRLVTLIGPPGVGKTCLALHTARAISDKFAHGIAFVNLMPVSEPDMVLPAIATTLGISELSKSSVDESLKAALQRRNMLIVLDNFEQVVEAAPQLLPILGKAIGLKFLVTSRETLRLRGEHQFPLSPLPVPEKDTQDKTQLKDFAAVQLFIERARAAKPDFELREQTAARVAEICRRLDGLPLAIELAAARSRTLSLTSMIEQFDRRFEWLMHGGRDLPAWRQTLWGAVEWSYNLLSGQERALFNRLSVFAGGWTLEAAESVCSDDVLCNSSSILDLLMQLVDKSLVTVDSEGGRYHFLETLREFAHEKLKENNELERTQTHHLAYFADWAEKMEMLLYKIPLQESRQLAEAEQNNLRVALNHAQGNDNINELSLRLVTAMAIVWFEHSHFREGWSWTERFLPYSLRPEHQRLRAKLLYRAAALEFNGLWKSKNIQSDELFLEAENLARNLGETKTLTNALYRHSEIYIDSKNWEKAKTDLTEAALLCREFSYFPQLILILSNLGLVLDQLDFKDEARAALDEALQIASRSNDVRGEVYALRLLANNLRNEKKFKEALSINKRALNVANEVGDRFMIGRILANLSVLENVLDDYPASGEYAKESYEVSQAIGNEYQQPFPLRMMAYAAIHAGDLKQARTLCMESLKGNYSMGPEHKVGVLACLITLAEIELAENNLEQVLSLMAVVDNELKQESISFQEPDERTIERIKRSLDTKKKKAGFASIAKKLKLLSLEQIMEQIIN